MDKLTLFNCITLLICCIHGCNARTLCNPSSEETQCAEGEICRIGGYQCVPAENCTDSNECSGTLPDCTADYCHPRSCSTTGECVHGHVCSQDSNLCVYSRTFSVEEGEEFELVFSEPERNYDTITWYKGSRAMPIVEWDETSGDIVYHGDFCEWRPSCPSSNKGELNVLTGHLTIHAINVSDEDFYYYEFTTDLVGVLDTGVDYEIHVEVNVTVKEEDIAIVGLPDSLPDGSIAVLNCEVPRMKPAATDIYWIFDRAIHNGTFDSYENSDGTFYQNNIIELNFTRDNNDELLQCVVTPVSGPPVKTEKVINVVYPPSGAPMVFPEELEHRKNEKVVMTCNTNDTDANPKCSTFIWYKLDNSSEQFPMIMFTDTLEFVMQDSSVGSYTCRCKNSEGASEESRPAELLFVETTEESSDDDLTMIFVALFCVATLIALILGGVLLWQKFRKNESPACNYQQDTTREVQSPHIEIALNTPAPAPNYKVEDDTYLDPTATQYPGHSRSVRNVYENQGRQRSVDETNYQKLNKETQDTDEDVYEEVGPNIAPGSGYYGNV